MNMFFKYLVAAGCLLAAAGQVRSQGYIVPNGIVTNLFAGEIDVWNPGTQVTGFIFRPIGKQEPTTYTNVFRFDEPLTIGVRVFLVASNDPISLQPIMAQTYPELMLLNDYVFSAGEAFYVGVYTGANFAPPYPATPPYTYLDPVFGWAKLINNQGVIQVLDSALEYQGGGIFAGTQNIIPVPEPSVALLISMGALVMAARWRLVQSEKRVNP